GTPAGQALARTAGTMKLESARLERWLAATKEPAVGAGSPLYMWRRIAELGPTAGVKEIAAKWRQTQEQSNAYAVADAKASRRPEDIELADFPNSGFKGWFVQDQAFATAPLRPGD